MTRAFVWGAGVLGAVLSGSGMPKPAHDAPTHRMAVPSAVSADVGSVRLEPLATGLGNVTAITSAGDGRLFLTIQTGTVRIWDGAQLLPTPFLDVSAKIVCCGEQGLLSTAFHPAYAVNGLFFVDYTDSNGDTVIERYRVSSSDPNRAEVGSAAPLLMIDQPFDNHNGGQLQFGPDRFLYIGMGDGGSANDPNCNAQSESSLLGKLLRIDVDLHADSPPFHAIPADNPFRTTGGAPPEAWAKGLRNPWRFSFDRVTGDLIIGDVGQGDREEIDFQPAGSAGGQNYGWKVMEGTLCGGGGNSGCVSAVPPCGDPAYTDPVAEYDHGDGRCSVTGGYVYRGLDVPELYGLYVFGDYCSGEIRWALPQPGTWSSTPFPFSAPNLTTFGEDSLGELYAATQDGALYRFVSAITPTASVTDLGPPSGFTRGGLRVTIHGSNFTRVTQVFFGTAPAAVSVASPTSLTAIAPPAPPGAVDVTVVNPGTSAATLPHAFTYEPIRRVAPPGATRTVER